MLNSDEDVDPIWDTLYELQRRIADQNDMIAYLSRQLIALRNDHHALLTAYQARHPAFVDPDHA